MNVYNTSLNTVLLYYPLGNTPSVCLTQDLPPEQEADILLLGCGDARSILFTCCTDNSRKIDVTCCDIEPMIHARNVLLFTLLIDDRSNHDIELIWNIYHNWKLDENSLKLLESQIEKLLELSQSIDQWHESIYGSSIRFCNERSLSCVRSYWSGFTTKCLSPSEKRDRLTQLQDAINRSKAHRQKLVHKPDGMGYRSTFPTSAGSHAYKDVAKVTKQWWDSGVAPSSNSSAQHSAHLNPAFLYSPNNQLTLYVGTSPLGGIPLSTAYTAINKGSAFCLKNKSTSFTEHLVDCAKCHFTQWASAFRKTVANGSVIRIFSGDALALCFTLRNCQLTQSTSMNLFCHNLTSSPLILHHSDYGHNNNAAPLSFDIVDTSNLADHIGLLNLVVLSSSLLKYHVSSCFYTELLTLVDHNAVDRLNSLFGVEVRSLALLLGLVLPDLFTNATNSVEEYPSIRKITNEGVELVVSARSRLRWRHSNSPNVQAEASELAKFIIQIYDAMFKLEDSSLTPLLILKRDPLAVKAELYKRNVQQYNHASFALLLSFLKANVISNWDECIKEIYDTIFCSNSMNPVKLTFMEDLGLHMHIFGVDDSLITKPDPLKMRSLASILPKCENSSDQLCVTIRVGRKYLEFFTKVEATLAIICSFEARNSYHKWLKFFASPKILFGKWHEQNEAYHSYPFIEEDSSQLFGTSDMFVSVMVPTSMLTSMLFESEHSLPLVKCGLKHSLSNLRAFGQELGSELCFSCHEIISKDVFITQFMPGMSGLPTFSLASNIHDKESSDATVVHFSPDDAKINSLVKHLAIESEMAKTKLAMKSAVKVEFKSPLTAVVRIAGSSELTLKFPIPVSVSKYKVRVARKSSYVEVESRLLDPLEEDAPAFLFPVSLMKVPSGIVPAPWTSMRVDLDTMPSCDLNDSQELSWLLEYLGYTFSVRELQTQVLTAGYDFRSSLKQGLTLIFTLYTGFEGTRTTFFELENTDSRLKIFILPSCFRLDLANNTVVLDSALIILTDSVTKDPLLAQFFLGLSIKGLFPIKLRKDENVAWKAMMPALIERCRTWKHTSECEYVQAGEVPLPRGLSNDGELPFCSCGIGKFPADYLKDQIEKIPSLSYVLSRYATRAAISPIFPVQYVEDCDTSDLAEQENCKKCGSDKRKNVPANEKGLLRCSRCKMAKYCSADCQKADWKKHKQVCKAT